MNKKAVILLSGGIDSTTTLFWARNKNYKCYCLIFDYNQRHKKEIECAKKIAKNFSESFYIVKINLPWSRSTLVLKGERTPTVKRVRTQKFEKEYPPFVEGLLALEAKGVLTLPPVKGVCTPPATYVEGRNTIFLSYALSFTESIDADYIFFGANSIDYSGYPDCRSEYINAFEKMANLATKRAVIEGKKIKIEAPLVNMTKAEIIKLAFDLKVPLDMTWSCYEGKEKPCGICDSCRFREKGFKEANLKDPLLCK